MNMQSLATLPHIDRIDLLLGHPQEQRDMAWLEASLQSAVSVEFSTIPPYLCALWSIKDETDDVAKSIRNVVQEEMLHMALACNMLTAVGCVPKIRDPHSVPTYPGHVPGAVHPELTVSLSGLSDASLDVFSAIEEPTRGPSAAPGPEHDTGYKTIGAFYDAILDAFRTLKPELSTERQVTGPLAYMVMEDLHAVEAAITLIKDQGEGSEASPVVAHTDELAHYHRFLEVRHCKRFSGLDASGQPIFDGPPLPRPETWPMAVVPAGGYTQSAVPADVWKLANRFDQTFTQLVDRLQAVWEHGDQASLVHAVETMFALSEQARALMSIEIAGGPGTYGPSFRLL